LAVGPHYRWIAVNYSAFGQSLSTRLNHEIAAGGAETASCRGKADFRASRQILTKVSISYGFRGTCSLHLETTGSKKISGLHAYDFY
jgi:hypothetical protein